MPTPSRSSVAPLAVRWPATSSSLRSLATDEQFDHEQRRQDLLDQRWKRWRSMLTTATLSAGVLTGAIPLGKAMDGVLKLIG